MEYNVNYISEWNQNRNYAAAKEITLDISNPKRNMQQYVNYISEWNRKIYFQIM
jgi:hypothetical protein